MVRLGWVRLGQLSLRFSTTLTKSHFLTLSQVMIVSGSPLPGGFKVAAAEKRM